MKIISRKINSILRRFESFIMKFRVSRLVARFNGPKVFANSVPKCGTNVLIRCLSLFHNLSHGSKYIYQTHSIENIEKKLKNNGKGRFASGHLYPTKEVINLLKRLDFKSILIIRDPRDMIISQYKFLLKAKNHQLHNYFKQISDKVESLKIHINGVPDENCPVGEKKNLGLDIGTRFQLYKPWFDVDLNLVIKFENLIGSKGGGTIECRSN